MFDCVSAILWDDISPINKLCLTVFQLYYGMCFIYVFFNVICLGADMLNHSWSCNTENECPKMHRGVYMYYHLVIYTNVLS